MDYSTERHRDLWKKCKETQEKKKVEKEQKQKEKRRERYLNNVETNREKSREYGRLKRNKMREGKDPVGLERLRKSKREYIRSKRHLPEYKIQNSLRGRLSTVVNKIKKGYKQDHNGSTLKWLGCTYEELVSHLESQFKPGMTWKNHGKDGWHIDHIRPICSVDFDDITDVEEVFHYTNLQPLWSWENMEKSGKWVQPVIKVPTR